MLLFNEHIAHVWSRVTLGNDLTYFVDPVGTLFFLTNPGNTLQVSTYHE